jgi:uncharacterized integral membrane protein
MNSFKIICLLILLAFVALFTFQNTAVAEVRFLLWTFSMSVSLMLLSSLFAGIVIGLFLSFLNSWQKNRREKNPGPTGSSFPEGH